MSALIHWLAFWAALLLPTSAMAASGTNSAGLACRMGAPAKVAKGKPVPFKFGISNRGKKTVYVLTWNTPLEGFFGKSLRIIGPQGELQYRGAMVKRGTPAREDYVRILPGATVWKTMDLAAAYELAFDGEYEVTFVGRIHDVTTEKIPREMSEHAGADVQCQALRFEIERAAG